MLSRINGTMSNNYQSKLQNEPSFGLMAKITGLDHDYLNPPLRHFYDAIEALEKEGAEVRTTFSVGRESRTYIACENKNGKRLRELLAKFGLDPNFKLEYKKIDVKDIPTNIKGSEPEIFEHTFNKKADNKVLSFFKSIFGISK